MFSLNGELLVDPSAGDAAFTEIAGETFVPACTLGVRDNDDDHYAHYHQHHHYHGHTLGLTLLI